MTRFHPDLPKPFVHTGFTPRRAAVCTGEEVTHGLREIPQRLLLHRLTAGTKPPVLGARVRQLRGLLDIAGRLAARLPVLLLLYRQIPHKARVPAVRQQCLLLLSGRQQTKSGHIRITATTDSRGRSARAPRDWLPPRTEVLGFHPKETSMSALGSAPRSTKWRELLALLRPFVRSTKVVSCA